MKKFDYKKISVGIISFVMFLFVSINIAAAVSYTSLEPNAFPGVTTTGNLTSFLSTIFSFGIAAAVALALIMIIWGGIIKMTTDSWMGKSDANSKIQNAVYGLGLALISWLLLYTINPCLVQFTATKDGCTATNKLLN